MKENSETGHTLRDYTMKEERKAKQANQEIKTKERSKHNKTKHKWSKKYQSEI